jgi:hypothetical protein
MVWDPHYDGQRSAADNPGYANIMGITIQAELAKDYPGNKLTLCPMEENGSRCDWDRGLAHAHNWNTNLRNGDCFTWLGTANTLNIVNNKEAVAPKTGTITIGKKDAQYIFPKYSYTIITLKK